MKFRVALAVYWLALVAATHYPSVRLPEQVPNSDKIVHFVAFGGLALVCWLFVTRRARTPSASAAWRIALVLIPYAAVDEYTQQFVGRQTDLADWIADVGGIVLVLAVLEIRRRLVARVAGARTG